MARPRLRLAWMTPWTATLAGTPNAKNASFSAFNESAISKVVGFSMKVARPVRVELTTYSFGGCRSIHLSYGRTVAFHRKAVESHTRGKCDVPDYSNACLACAPECSRGAGWTAFLALAHVRSLREGSFSVQPFARDLMS
jgi:hypothetical protein